MEYYIFLTYNCNMRCTYCLAKEVLSNDQKLNLSRKRIEEIIKYIIKEKDKNEETRVVFFGGEPLLKPKIMGEFIRRLSPINASFAVYTNGLLLDRVPLSVLNSLDVILVSLDGDQKAHEKYRGKGTYKVIIDNIKKMKPQLYSTVIGRITVEEETDIYSSANNILKEVDAVYWQLVNKPSFENKEKFIVNYKKGVSELFDLWLDHFKKGEILKIIPFQVIVSSLVFDYNNNGKSFRCGTTNHYKAIGLDGSIYICDEYIGSEKGILGNINNGTQNMPEETHEDIFEDCRKCEVTNICLGRCRKCLLEYSVDQKRVYCELTKYLITTINQHIDEIKEIAGLRNYSIDDIYGDGLRGVTEEIP
ncbi:MAG: radical SAM protein [Candidatus Aminicenantales bacterium]